MPGAMKNLTRLVGLLVVLLPVLAQATDAIPHCYFKGSDLPVDNARVEELERTTANQYKTQGHVRGILTQIYADHTGHKHFAIEFEGIPGAGIEVIYNEVFGALPELKVGMVVEACGEYITSTQPTGHYPASPMGAIIHWVHINPNQGFDAHPSGFVMLDGVLYGQDATKADHSRGRNNGGRRSGGYNNDNGRNQNQGRQQGGHHRRHRRGSRNGSRNG